MDSNKRLWLYAGIVLVAGVGLVTVVSTKKPALSLPAVTPPVPIGPGSRILVLGDSLAQGLAPPMRQLATEAGATLAVDGRVGTRIEQWARESWLGAALAVVQPTHVLVSLGTNDMLMTDPSTELPALGKLVEALRSSGASLVWITPPAMRFPDRGVRAMIAQAGVPFFRSESLTIPRGPDGVHPTASGYAGWAGQIFKVLRQPVALGRLPPRRPLRARGRSSVVPARRVPRRTV